MSDRLCEDRGPAIFQLVTVHRCNHSVAEAQCLHGLGDAEGLFPIKFQRSSCGYRAVMAPARANVPQDQKRGGTVVPAFPDVGTTSFFADGVESQGVHGPPDVLEIRPLSHGDLKPGRETPARTADLMSGYESHDVLYCTITSE